MWRATNMFRLGAQTTVRIVSVLYNRHCMKVDLRAWYFKCIGVCDVEVRRTIRERMYISSELLLVCRNYSYFGLLNCTAYFGSAKYFHFKYERIKMSKSTRIGWTQKRYGGFVMQLNMAIQNAFSSINKMKTENRMWKIKKIQ